jgi:hypothetical protein
MPRNDRDPVQAVKAFLRSGITPMPAASQVGSIAPDLREIRERLGRARKVEQGISLSEALEFLLAVGQNPPA